MTSTKEAVVGMGDHPNARLALIEADAPTVAERSIATQPIASLVIARGTEIPITGRRGLITLRRRSPKLNGVFLKNDVATPTSRGKVTTSAARPHGLEQTGCTLSRSCVNDAIKRSASTGITSMGTPSTTPKQTCSPCAVGATRRPMAGWSFYERSFTCSASLDSCPSRLVRGGPHGRRYGEQLRMGDSLNRKPVRIVASMAGSVSTTPGAMTQRIILSGCGFVPLATLSATSNSRLARWRVFSSGHGAKAMSRTNLERQGSIL